jgi:NTE family protein
MESFGSARDYQRVEALFRGAKSWGPHTLNLSVSGGTDLGSDMPPYEAFMLGGPLRLSAYRVGQFTGREFAFGRLMYYNRILPLPDLLGSGVYAGGSLEVGHIRDRFDGRPSPGTLWSASVFLGADTFAGPGYLGVGGSESGNWSVYLLLGVP